MKKIVSLMLVLALCLGCLAGCTTPNNPDDPTGEGEGSKLIGVCMQNKSSSIAVLQEEALKEMFEPLGYEVQVVSADDSSATQRSQVENFILMQAEMLVILPCEISTLEDSLVKAREAGIKVVVSGGTGTVSEDAYDAVCSDDEFMVGMYVASVAKTWIEGNLDPNGDWEVHFLSSTLSEDAITRCKGEAMILEPWLKNLKGEYVNLMGEVVDEANKVENPVYCEMVASRVSSYDACSTQMSMTDNRGVVSGVLTEHPNVRVFIAYNSLASTAGSTYITDTYSAEDAKEFAFFSGGVMGDEYEYLIGSVAENAGTYSCFRGACQFGGGDAAATLADLCNRVMFGEAGKDYGKTNPNTIGLYFPIDGEINNGVDALVCFDSPSYISSYTYEEVLKHEKLMTYWDSTNGYNDNMQENPGQPGGETGEPTEPAELENGTAYTTIWQGMGEETHEIDLMDDGTCKFFLPGSAFITDVYQGTYTIGEDGVTVTIKGLTNVDPESAYKIPGLWSYIDAVTGDATIIIDPETKTYSVPGAETPDEPAVPPTEPVEPVVPGEGTVYTYKETNPMGLEIVWTLTLKDDGTYVLTEVNDFVGEVSYEGASYTVDGNTVTCGAMASAPAVSEWAKAEGFVATISGETFNPGAEAAGEDVVYTYSEKNGMGLEIAWTLTLKADGTYVLTEVNDFVGEVSYEGASYTVDGNTVTCGAMASAPAISEWAKAEGFAATIEEETFTPVVE